MPSVCSKCKFWCESIHHTPDGDICNTCTLVFTGARDYLQQVLNVNNNMKIEEVE